VVEDSVDYPWWVIKGGHILLATGLQDKWGDSPLNFKLMQI